MTISTSLYRSYASALASRRKYWDFSDVRLKIRHEAIQKRLNEFVDYFNQSANAYENVENDLLHRASNLHAYFQDGKMRYNHYENWNLLAQLTKQEKDTYLSAGVQWSLKEAGVAYRNPYVYAGLDAKLGTVQAKGSCEIGLWKEEKFDPRFQIGIETSASLLEASAQAKIGNSNLYLQTQANGRIGTVYAQAQCVLNKEEQDLEASIGAAALQGEAGLCFSLFGAKINVSLQGSLGSAEAEISYHHKNKEWEFGSKLGFIAGLGFKINISY